MACREDSFISYRTNNYKLHYYETPTNLKFVMITDTKTNNLRVVLHQIYVNLYVEYGIYPICFFIFHEYLLIDNYSCEKPLITWVYSLSR